MNILSLFDGMSCLQISINRLGIKYNEYFASEIDMHAIKVTQANYPDTVQIGSVVDVMGHCLPKIDLIAFGSPCQGFSFAGKGLNFEDPRSKLFFEAVRILNECRVSNPDILFLCENVRMKKEHEVVISKYLGVEPLMINSALVSAQNRVRLYWTNIAAKPYNLFGDIMPDIPQPADKGILLKDILQPPSDLGEKYYISEVALARILRKKYSDAKIDPDKTGTINTKNNSGQLSADSGTTLITETAIGRGIKIENTNKVPPLRSHDGCAHDNKIVGHGCVNSYGELRDLTDGKSLNIDANYYKGMDNHGASTMIIQKPRGYNTGGEFFEKSPTLTSNSWEQNNHVSVCCAMRGRNPDNRKAGLPTEQMIEDRNDQKTNTITSVQKDNLRREIKQLNPSTESGGIQPYQQNRIYDDSGITPALTAEMSCSTMAIKTASRIRRLTEIECERLQTVDDNYTNHVSSTQRYKMLGNGWNIDTIVHILSYGNFPKI